MDDSTNSFHTIETAIEFYEKSKSCLKETNFELGNWATNSFELEKYIDSNENYSRSKNDVSDSETCGKFIRQQQRLSKGFGIKLAYLCRRFYI